MARTALAAQDIVAAGLEATYEAANADGNSFRNDGNTILHVVNADDDTTITVTVQTPAQLAGLDVAELEVEVPFGESRFIGNLTPNVYNRPAGAADPGAVYVDYSAVDGVTVAVLEP